jgi:hypothetical protein
MLSASYFCPWLAAPSPYIVMPMLRLPRYFLARAARGLGWEGGLGQRDARRGVRGG